MTTRGDAMRLQVQQMVRAVPFGPFVITLENRQRLVVDHPENIAFRPDENSRPGSRRFYVVTDDTWVHSTFEAITSVTHSDQPATESAP
jgi:hypothetical protein